ncbi:hypothetical protein A8U91_02387 [Halomonas elongata]|uniref:Uncharacterized protein n=1 Tax=Halomonas elongata TaxID=2746 RepID=A0A1B8P6Y9_HALEL|nr:hypothetical protein A8U91_02387 [Halomonas elongata]
MVPMQIADQPQAIGSIAARLAIRVQRQGIHRPGPPGTMAEGIAEPIRLFLERHRDIGSPAAFGGEGSPGTGEVVQGRLDGDVLERLPGLGGEGGMDRRRLRVTDGMAEDTIAIVHWACSSRSASPSQSRGRR